MEIIALWNTYTAAEGGKVKREAANNLLRSIVEEENAGELPNQFLLDLLKQSGIENLTANNPIIE